MTTNTREWIVGLVVLTFGLLTIFYIIPTQVELTEDYERTGISPAFFPTLAAWIVVVLGGVLLLNCFIGSHAEEEKKGRALSLPEELRVLASFGVAFLFVFCYKYLGFLIATLVSLLIFFTLQGIRSILKRVIMSMANTIFVYLFFHYVMKVHFLPGMLFR